MQDRATSGMWVCLGGRHRLCSGVPGTPEGKGWGVGAPQSSAGTWTCGRTGHQGAQVLLILLLHRLLPHPSPGFQKLLQAECKPLCGHRRSPRPGLCRVVTLGARQRLWRDYGDVAGKVLPRTSPLSAPSTAGVSTEGAPGAMAVRGCRPARSPAAPSSLLGQTTSLCHQINHEMKTKEGSWVLVHRPDTASLLNPHPQTANRAITPPQSRWQRCQGVSLGSTGQGIGAPPRGRGAVRTRRPWWLFRGC